MGKTREELTAEIGEKAKERMDSALETVPEPDATLSGGRDATVYEENATVQESDTTVYEAETAGLESVSEPSYARGEILLDTYTVASNPIHGGMGSVWRVHHNGWDADLAMKRPQATLFQSEKQKASFIHECEAWINLGLHPNIVSCYFVREIDGVPTIFSEWMDNGSLENQIESGRLYTGTEAEQQERILDIAIQFARGLHYAHEQGLIHQDVKPDNLLLSKEWEGKVADFGLAKARAQLTILEGVNTVADPGATVIAPSGGYTPAYCSMEQMDGKPLTRRTDIYSWAISVMEMYIGSRPWMNGVVAGLNCKDYFAGTKVLMPKALQELLMRCMASEPQNRPHNFVEIETELQSIYRAETGRGYPRPVSAAAADTADSLNNRALSFLDIGKAEEAEKLWEKALGLSPNHPDSTFNRGLFQWRAGKVDDVAFCEQLLLYNNNNHTFEDKISLFQDERARVQRFAVESLRQYALRGELLENPYCVSENGQFALLEDESTGLFLKDLHRGEIVRHYSRPCGIYSLSPDGSIAALSCHDSVGEPCVDIVPLQGHSAAAHLSDSFLDAPLIMAFSHDGKSLYVGMNNGAVLKVSADGCIEAKSEPTEYRVESLRVIDRGRRIIAGASNGELFILDSDQLAVLHIINSNGDSVLSIDHHDGNIIAFGRKTVRIIDDISTKCLRTIILAEWLDEAPHASGGWVDSTGTINVCHEDEVICFAYSAPKAVSPYMLSRIQSSSQRGESDATFARLCEEASGRIKSGDYGTALKLLEQARAISGYESDLRLLDLNEEVGAFRKKTGIRGLYLRGSFDGIVSDYSAAAHSIYIGERLQGCLIKSNLVTESTVQSENRMAGGNARDKICVGDSFVACTCGKRLNILALSDCQRIQTFELSTQNNPYFFTSALKYCPGKHILMVGTGEGVIKLWDTISWECIFQLDTGMQECLAADINDDATMVLAAGNKNRLKVYDIQTSRTVTDIALPDDKKVVNIWDAVFSGDRIILQRYYYFITEAFPEDRVDIYNIQSVSPLGDDLRTLKVTPFGKMLKAIPGSGWLACSHDGAPEFTFFTADGSQIQNFKLFNLRDGYEMSDVRFSFDGRFVVVSAVKNRDGEINLWEIDWIYE